MLCFSWDADCEMFLKILRGELAEGVYDDQARAAFSGPISADPDSDYTG